MKELFEILNNSKRFPSKNEIVFLLELIDDGLLSKRRLAQLLIDNHSADIHEKVKKTAVAAHAQYVNIFGHEWYESVFYKNMRKEIEHILNENDDEKLTEDDLEKLS